MKLKEILKVIYYEDLEQPIKLCIVDASGYFTRHAKCYKDALELAIEYKDYEVLGIHAVQILEKPAIRISIENFDYRYKISKRLGSY